MAVVVQSAFRIEVLALEAQRVVDFFYVETADLAVGAVVGGPDDFAVWSGEFLGRAEVVELVVVGLGVLWIEAFQQGERPKTIGFVEVAAMPIRMVFGDQFVALPEKLGRYAIDGFADAPPKRVVAVTRGLAVGLGEADQSMLAVVAVLGNELMALAAPFTDQVAEGVIVLVPVALDHQPIAGDDVRAGAVVHQQVTGRGVAEAFLQVLRMVCAGEAA